MAINQQMLLVWLLSVYNESIKELSGHFFDLGLCFGFGTDGSNDYMCGIEWDKEDVPGFESFEYPVATWLKFEAKGTISGQIWLPVAIK